MATFKEHINTWQKYAKSKTEPKYEDPEVMAGRRAETMLRHIVDGHVKFRGSHCFTGKRVYNKALGHKNEIDLIVVSDKQLYILECKNWSGSLVKRDGKWVQIKDPPGQPYK